MQVRKAKFLHSGKWGLHTVLAAVRISTTKFDSAPAMEKTHFTLISAI